VSSTWLLRPQEYLNGIRVVTTRLRPAKLAVAVPDDDPRIAVRAVQSCCAAWGGYAYLIVPCSRGAGLSDKWEAVLEAMDPDALVDCGVLSDEDKERLEARDRFVRDWREPQTTLFLGETLQHSALAAFGKWFSPPDSEHFAVVPELDEDDPLYLPLVARFGVVDDDALRRAIRRHMYEYRDLPVDYSDFVRLERIDFSGHLEDALLGRVPGSEQRDGDSDAGFKLVDLTCIGLSSSGVLWSGGGTPERPEIGEGYANCVIVTGEPNSVSDLALYWDLRSDRVVADPFPLWVPLGVLDSAQGKSVVEQALEVMDLNVRREHPKGSQLYIVSASADSATLEARLGSWFPGAGIRTDGLRDFFTGRWKLYLAEEEAPVYFEAGRASMPYPRPQEMRDAFLPHHDRVVYELSLDGVRFPQSKALGDAIYGHGPNRITKDGTLEHSAFVASRSPREHLRNLQLPDGWTVLASAFEEHGYDCIPTQKSNLALGQLSLLGGVDSLTVLASSKIHNLLKELSGRTGEQRAFATTERRTVALHRFEQAWGRNAGRILLRWFVERRILLRGAELTCPRCRLKRWYAVDRIDEMWRCDGCQEDMPIPLNPDATHWQYRINELFAAGYDQGTITPLLTFFLMHTAWGDPTGRGSAAIRVSSCGRRTAPTFL
jgi:hypothetical protein